MESQPCKSGHNSLGESLKMLEQEVYEELKAAVELTINF